MATSQQNKFKTNIVDFINFCKDVLKEIKEKTQINVNLDDLTTLEEIIKLITPDKLIQKFIDSTYKYWEKIRLKDHEFFDKNYATIFGEEQEDRIKILKYVFVESNSDAELKQIIWEYLHSFVKISIIYIHGVKGPTSSKVLENGKNKIKRLWKNKEEYQDIKLVDLSSNWSVELPWPDAT